jgi:hypothetical protein
MISDKYCAFQIYVHKNKFKTMTELRSATLVFPFIIETCNSVFATLENASPEYILKHLSL